MVLTILILLLFISLIFIVIKIALWQGAISLLIKRNIDTSKLVIPAFISLICQYIIIFITSTILYHFDIRVLNIIYERFMRFDYSKKNLYLVLASYIISTILIICVQAVILSLASKLKVKNHLNNDYIEDQSSTDDQTIESYESYTFSNRIFTGLFEFSIIFIFLLIFSVVGFLLGPKLFL